jgi:hypothetical protein
VSEGYGRGYYGSGQLEQSEPKKRSWFKVIAVLGLGATAVWLFYPRKKPFAGTLPSGVPIPNFDAATIAAPSAPSIAAPSASSAPPQLIDGTFRAAPLPAPTTAIGAFQKQLEDDARARGFVMVKDYEDSVVASAKQLQAAGAQVVLAPHLQHLASRLETNEPTPK